MRLSNWVRSNPVYLGWRHPWDAPVQDFDAQYLDEVTDILTCTWTPLAGVGGYLIRARDAETTDPLFDVLTVPGAASHRADFDPYAFPAFNGGGTFLFSIVALQEP